MLLPLENWNLAYRTILKSSNNGAHSTLVSSSPPSPVLLLVPPKVDAMCACRILSYMLRSDSIPYKVCPVTSYDDVRKVLTRDLTAASAQSSSSSSTPSGSGSVGRTSIVLLGLGASIDLSPTSRRPLLPLNADASANATFFVLDDARPVSHGEARRSEAKRSEAKRSEAKRSQPDSPQLTKKTKHPVMFASLLGEPQERLRGPGERSNFYGRHDRV